MQTFEDKDDVAGEISIEDTTVTILEVARSIHLERQGVRGQLVKHKGALGGENE